MFRNITRFKQALSENECLELLKNEKRGILSVLGDDDYPYGLPINHFYNEKDGKIYFHGGKKGHKIDAINKHNKASFCIYDEGFKKDNEWSLNIKSVIVFGRIEFIEDKDKIAEISRLLSYKFIDDDDYINSEIERLLDNTVMFALNIEHITGKLVNEA